MKLLTLSLRARLKVQPAFHLRFRCRLIASVVGLPLLMLAFLSVVFSACAQGTIDFRTSILGSSAKVLEAMGFPGAGQPLGNTAAGVASGTQFLAQLFIAPGVTNNYAALVPVGNPVNFRGGTINSGYVQESGTTSLGLAVDSTVTIPASVLPTPGGAVTVQLRAWWAGPTGNIYPSWESAFSTIDPLMRMGWSPLLYLPRTGNPLTEPPETPVQLTGLSGFNLGWLDIYPPYTVSSPQNQAVQVGSNATFSVSASLATYYEWRKDTVLIPGATNASYTITNATLADAGFYEVKAGNAFGWVTAGATLTVYVPVSFTDHPMSQAVPLHGTVLFEAGAAGYPPPSYQWRLNGAVLPGENNPTLTVTNVTAGKLGGYSLTAWNAYSMATSAVAMLYMSPSVSSPFVGITAIWGKEATLSVAAVGSGQLFYQWYKDGELVENGTNSTLYFPSVQFDDGALYSVVVTSMYGSVTNTPALLVVNPANIALGLYAGITIDGVPGNTYGIQYSTDLTDPNSWTTLTNLTLTQPLEIWIDTTVAVHAPGNARRYYRVIAP